MSKNLKLFFANSALFSIGFIVLYFNSVYMPSLIDGKQRNIEVIKNIMGIKDTVKLSECNFKCANDCLKIGDLTELTFRQCLYNNCACEFVPITSKTNSTSYFEFYLAFCVILSTFIAIYFYLKNNFLNFQSFVKMSEYSELKEFFLGNNENFQNENDYKRIRDY